MVPIHALSRPFSGRDWAWLPRVYRIIRDTGLDCTYGSLEVIPRIEETRASVDPRRVQGTTKRTSV